MPKGIPTPAAPRGAKSLRFPGFEAPRYNGGIRWLPAIVFVSALVLVVSGSAGLLTNGPHAPSSLSAGASVPGFVSIRLPGNAEEIRSSDGATASGTVPAGNSSTYNVTFAETGLPSKTKWSIKVDGTTESETKNQIVFTLPNGSYTYHVLVVPGYTPSKSSGIVNVTGNATKITVKFAAVMFTITFTEAGLPAQTLWTVTLTPSSGTPSNANSTTSTITFSVPNGSYTYSIASIGGYQITSGTSTGSVSISGASPAPITVGWSQSSSRRGLSLSLLDYLVIAVAAAWVVIGIVLILRRRRQRASPRLWIPPASAAPTAPPTRPPPGPSPPPSGPEEPSQDTAPPSSP